MKVCGMALVILLCAGCASMSQVDHSVYIDTDPQGYAVGQYRDVRSGNFCRTGFILSGGGGGWGSVGGGGLGLGGLALTVEPPSSESNPLNFARSIAMINYSRKLKSLRYDEAGDLLEYEFESKPDHPRGYRSTPSQPVLPKSFGRQGVQ